MKAPVLKTGDGRPSQGSNPCLSAIWKQKLSQNRGSQLLPCATCAGSYALAAISVLLSYGPTARATRPWVMLSPGGQADPRSPVGLAHFGQLRMVAARRAQPKVTPVSLPKGVLHDEVELEARLEEACDLLMARLVEGPVMR